LSRGQMQWVPQNCGITQTRNPSLISAVLCCESCSKPAGSVWTALFTYGRRPFCDSVGLTSEGAINKTAGFSRFQESPLCGTGRSMSRRDVLTCTSLDHALTNRRKILRSSPKSTDRRPDTTLPKPTPNVTSHHPASPSWAYSGLKNSLTLSRNHRRQANTKVLSQSFGNY